MPSNYQNYMTCPSDLFFQCSAMHYIAKMPTLLLEVKTSIELSGCECSIKVCSSLTIHHYPWKDIYSKFK